MCLYIYKIALVSHPAKLQPLVAMQASNDKIRLPEIKKIQASCIH